MISSNEFLKRVSTSFSVSYTWLLTGEGEMEQPQSNRLDDQLISWINDHPEVVRELRGADGAGLTSFPDGALIKHALIKQKNVPYLEHLTNKNVEPDRTHLSYILKSYRIRRAGLNG